MVCERQVLKQCLSVHIALGCHWTERQGINEINKINKYICERVCSFVYPSFAEKVPVWKVAVELLFVVLHHRSE